MFDAIIENFGEAGALASAGVLVGILFGTFAQRSRFCLRSSVIEFAHGHLGPKVAVWLLTFSSALFATQALIASGWLDVAEARQLAVQGSISGAAIGGVLFGVGMIMTRGCASRLLVLSANGNLRALLSGLVFAVAAQASYRGALAPLRETLTELWTVEGGAGRDLLAVFGLSGTRLAFAGMWLAAALFVATRNRLSTTTWLCAMGVGLTIALGWMLTYLIGQHSFASVTVRSVTFSGPSADMLMFVLSPARKTVNFEHGLLPGVFLGSFAAAALARELKLEGFTEGHSLPRYIAGAVLMGFGAMLAGGCAVGAGVTGGSVLALTAWITLACMWLGAAIADRLLDRHELSPIPGVKTEAVSISFSKRKIA